MENICNSAVNHSENINYKKRTIETEVFEAEWEENGSEKGKLLEESGHWWKIAVETLSAWNLIMNNFVLLIAQ